MCFSATGSFVISGVLVGIGATALARNSSVPHRLFAAIPLLFAAQQAAEGIVWLTMGDTPPTIVQRLAVNTYLGFALVVWPSWLPLSLKLIERNGARRRWLTFLFWCGTLVSMFAALMLTGTPPEPRIAGHSIT
ncbi:MAG TPA: DUF6629 family protein, partial [Polyangia bacterium]|nr:DUF6629 family protein [Polyangia bacterium]